MSRGGLVWTRPARVIDPASYCHDLARLDHSVAALRVGGDALLPDKTSQLLGAQPTTAHVKGKQVGGWSTGRPIYARGGLWLLEATGRKPENVDGQVQETLSQLTADLKVWASIKAQWKMDLFCGWFMKEGNEGLSLSPRTLNHLGQRGIELAINLYSSFDDDQAAGDSTT